MRFAPRLTNATKFTSVSVSSVALIENFGTENALYERKPVRVVVSEFCHRTARNRVNMPIRTRACVPAEEVSAAWFNRVKPPQGKSKAVKIADFAVAVPPEATVAQVRDLASARPQGIHFEGLPPGQRRVMMDAVRDVWPSIAISFGPLVGVPTVAPNVAKARILSDGRIQVL